MKEQIYDSICDEKVLKRPLEDNIRLVKSAEAKNDKGMVDAGICYEKGIGVEQDYTKALYWYEKATMYDNTYGYRNAGIFYKNGYGVKVDYKKAFEYFLQAANMDLAEAMVDVGVCYDFYIFQNSLSIYFY